MTAWKHFEEVLDSNIKNKEKFERLGDEHLVKFFQNNINELLLKEFNANRTIDKLVEKYDLDKKYLKTIFSPMYPLFDYNEEIVIEKFEKFIKFFGSLNILCKFIKNDCNTPDFSSKCIFDCDDNEIEEKIDFLQNLLSLTKRQTVLFIADNVYYFKIKNSFLESKINSYARALNTTSDIIKKKIIRYPNFFYAKTNKMAERVKGFARIYQLEENKAQEVILKYPTLIEYWITSHRDYYKILKQYINPTECICEYPFIYNFIDFVNGKFLGDFDNTPCNRCKVVFICIP